MIKQEPTINNYIERYRLNTYLLSKHPEQKELLERKIKESVQKLLSILQVIVS